MGRMEDVDANDGDHVSDPSAPQKSFEEAGRLSGESVQSLLSWTSRVASAGHRRSGSFQRWKNQMQRAWKWGPGTREQGLKSAFNPEVLANQKRQWYQLHSSLVG